MSPMRPPLRLVGGMSGLTGSARLFLMIIIMLWCVPASAQERPVVFVHGLASAGSSWREAAERLQATLAMHAETPDLSAGATYEVQADQLGARAATVGHDVVVVGHSNGGVVARQWSRDLRALGAAPRPRRPCLRARARTGHQTSSERA